MSYRIDPPEVIRKEMDTEKTSELMMGEAGKPEVWKPFKVVFSIPDLMGAIKSRGLQHVIDTSLEVLRDDIITINSYETQKENGETK